MSLIFQRPPFNYQYQVGQANLIEALATNFTVAGVASQVEFARVVLAPNVFSLDGQLVVAHFYGRLANPTGIATIRSFINGAAAEQIFSVNKAAVAGTSGYVIRESIWRRSASAVEVFTEIFFNLSNSATPATLLPVGNNILRGNMTPQAEMSLSLDITLVAGDSLTHNISHVFVI